MRHVLFTLLFLTIAPSLYAQTQTVIEIPPVGAQLEWNASLVDENHPAPDRYVLYIDDPNLERNSLDLGLPLVSGDLYRAPLPPLTDGHHVIVLYAALDNYLSEDSPTIEVNVVEPVQPPHPSPNPPTGVKVVISIQVVQP